MLLVPRVALACLSRRVGVFFLTMYYREAALLMLHSSPTHIVCPAGHVTLSVSPKGHSCHAQSEDHHRRGFGHDRQIHIGMAIPKIPDLASRREIELILVTCIEGIGDRAGWRIAICPSTDLHCPSLVFDDETRRQIGQLIINEAFERMASSGS